MRKIVQFVGGLLLLTICVLSTQINPAYADGFSPNIAAPLFDPQRVASEGADFEFSNDGYILDGPRRGKGEPVDYSVLIRDEKIVNVFVQSVFWCSKSVRDCAQPSFRWDTKVLPIKAFAEENALPFNKIFKLVLMLADGIEAEGFSVPVAPDIDTAKIVVIAGGREYLKRQARQIGARYLEPYYEWLKVRGGEDASIAIVKKGETCFVSTIHRQSRGRVYLFLQPDDLELCLQQMLFDASGLHWTPGFFPTVTGGDHRFSVPTLVDKVFIRALYDEDFPVDGGEAEVRSFFRQYLAENPIAKTQY